MVNNNAPDTYVASTLGEVAAFFGVQEQTCRAWRMRADPLPGKPGEWNLAEITHWRIQYERAKHRSRDEDQALVDCITEPGGEDWKDRWLRAKALLSEEQLSEVRGTLVDLEEIGPISSRSTNWPRTSESCSSLSNALARNQRSFQSSPPGSVMQSTIA